jgi:DNA repair exonuclease SbcCD ATPase subunit
MSQSTESLASSDETGGHAGFETALRGYDKRQVDLYVAHSDNQLQSLTAERERSMGQMRNMASHIQHLQAELAELQNRPPQVDKASFRHLGPIIDQMFALAEKQSEQIVSAATQRAANLQTEAEKLLADAREQDKKLRSEAAAAYEQAEQEAKRINDESAQQAKDAQAELEAMREKALAQVQEQVEAARARAQQEFQARRQALVQLQEQVESAQQRLTQSHQNAAKLENDAKQLQQRLDDVRAELTSELARLDEARSAAEAAEQHAVQVRARVQREAKRVADLAAAAVMAAAAGGGQTGEFPIVVRPAEAARPDDDAPTAIQPAANGRHAGHAEDVSGPPQPRDPRLQRVPADGERD